MRQQNLTNVVVMPQGVTASGAVAQMQSRAAETMGSLALAASPALAPVVEAVIASAAAVTADRRAEARMRGYEGENCGECGNFTMVRNGTCLKCDTCGSTSGCS